MARLREDARFRAVQPDSFDQETPETQGAQAEMEDAELDEGLELWFDWAFVEFWKNHYCAYSFLKFLWRADEIRHDSTVNSC